MMKRESFGISSLNLATLSLNGCDECAALRPSPGWGNAETRKAYTPLESLAESESNNVTYVQRHETSDSSSRLKPSYDEQRDEDFVGVSFEEDAMECDDNFF